MFYSSALYFSKAAQTLVVCAIGSGTAQSGQTASVPVNEGRIFQATSRLNCSKYMGDRAEVVSVGIELPEGCSLSLSIWRPHPHGPTAQRTYAYKRVAAVEANETFNLLHLPVGNRSLKEDDLLGVFVLTSSNEAGVRVSGVSQVCQWKDTDTTNISCLSETVATPAANSTGSLVNRSRTSNPFSRGKPTVPRDSF